MKSGEFELCVLAYNDDTVEPYLNEAFAKYIADGRLKVKTHYDDYAPVDGSPYACGYVKNLAHAMGCGDILFNLDADNFIDTVHDLLLDLKPNEVIKNINNGDGRSGRIGVYKTMFDKVQGYRDEGRNDDGDFIRRCLIVDAKLKLMDCEIAPIANFFDVGKIL